MYKELTKKLNASGTQLIAVSKTQSNKTILKLYQQGHKDFGENKVQELTEKHESLPKDIKWHFIGHLQTNKVKYIAPFIHLIHSADSAKILKEINKQAAKVNRIIPCLLQFKIAAEDTKYGFTIEEVIELLTSERFQEWKNIQIAGVMGMATYTENQQQVRSEFKQLVAYFNQLKKDFFPETTHFKEISMGMSGDYDIAQVEGSTLVRIGILLFGARVYT